MAERQTVSDVLGPLPTRQAPVHARSPISARNPMGPFLPSAQGGVQGVLHVDLGPALTKLSAFFAKYGKGVDHVQLARAINFAGDAIDARLMRTLAEQTGATLKKVRSVVKARRANASKLEYVWKASDQAMLLKDFATRMKPGQKNPTAHPWNISRSFKGAFVISGPGGGNPGIVKRVAKGHGKGSLKTLYGPIIPKELLRKNMPALEFLTNRAPLLIGPELDRLLKRASEAAGAK